ncbi:MAG: metallopeptidase family protein [Woeseiaceae bacterium]|nr:metallopeptidase family protein [Woeseiaceae bacterium]
MEHDTFQSIVHDAIEALPDWVHEALHNIDVIVLDEPDDYHDPEGQGLLGLYVGVPLPEREAGNAGELPDVIYIFRKPHLELGLSGDELLVEIEKTLVHEIAHYFGIDDDHLDEIGWG